MTGGKKLILLIVFMGLIALISLAVFSACDNRKAVNPKLDINQTVQLNLTPDRLVIRSTDKPDTVRMNLRVRDSDGNGIDSVEVIINRVPSVGTIVPPGLTYSGGFTTAMFVTDPGGLEDSIITFIATSGTASDTVDLEVGISLATVTMTLLPANLVVHSLNKPDTAKIDIRVRDGDGNGIDSVEIELSRSPEMGTIVPPEFTMYGGYTNALYITDPGSIEQDMQVTLTARSGSAVDTDVLNLLVSLQGEIDTMNISLGKHTLVANAEDNTNIYVSVLDTTGVPIGDGTVVSMENWGAGIGGSFDSNYVHTTNGIAIFTLTAPPFIDTTAIIDTDSLRAWGISESGDTSYAKSAITYIPDEPYRLEIVTVPYEMVAGSGENQEIEVRVFDAHGSFVRNGTQVRFKNDLITSDITSLTTTLGGYATGVYTVGTEAVLDIIRAFITTPGSTDTLWSNPVPLDIRSSSPTNISITTDNATIPVGGNPTMIFATMQDENGNPLSDGWEIIFQVTAGPDFPDISPKAPSFNYVASDDSACFETNEFTNVNGVASVTIFSGTQAGTVRIKVISVDNYSIFKEKPLITIQSGPPAVISIMPSNVAIVFGEAIATGITAAVWDQYTNPVEPLTAVHFEILPDTIAFIDGAAYTGGWIDTTTGEVVGTVGLASTWLAYSCLNTFDTVRVVASSGDMEDTSAAVVLALYQGTIAVDVQPGVIYLSPTHPDSVDYADVEAQLLDGLGCPIENGVINFTVENCGQISGPYSDTTDIQGYAYTVFKITYRQLIPDPDRPPHCEAKIKARLRGYPEIIGEVDCYCNANN